MSESAKICHVDCAVVHAVKHIYFSEARREITISVLHFSFRGRHSGKGPAAVSNQSGVVTHWKTDDVAQPTLLLANLYFVRKGKLYGANHLIGEKIPFHHFKTGICKMHVIVGRAALLTNGVLGTQCLFLSDIHRE